MNLQLHATSLPGMPERIAFFYTRTGMLKQDFFKKTIDEIADDLIYLTFYFQGEPYLNKNFLDMVQYATSKKIYTATSTNAHYLNDATVKKNN